VCRGQQGRQNAKLRPLALPLAGPPVQPGDAWPSSFVSRNPQRGRCGPARSGRSGICAPGPGAAAVRRAQAFPSASCGDRLFPRPSVLTGRRALWQRLSGQRGRPDPLDLDRLRRSASSSSIRPPNNLLEDPALLKPETSGSMPPDIIRISASPQGPLAQVLACGDPPCSGIGSTLHVVTCVGLNRLPAFTLVRTLARRSGAWLPATDRPSLAVTGQTSVLPFSSRARWRPVVVPALKISCGPPSCGIRHRHRRLWWSHRYIGLCARRLQRRSARRCPWA